MPSLLETLLTLFVVIMLKDDSLFLMQYAIRLSLLMDFPSLYALTAEYIEQKKLLGGLLLLLPPKFSPRNIDSTFGADKDIASLRNKLLELEWLLMHSNIPVSAINPPFFFSWDYLSVTMHIIHEYIVHHVT